jgi:hypothetical protein
MNPEQTVKVIVTYPPAVKPFKDDSASRTEQLGSLKTRILKAFELVEGSTPDGNQVTYHLFDGKVPLEDLGRTLGDLAGERPTLTLKMAQRIVQGSRDG